MNLSLRQARRTAFGMLVACVVLATGQAAAQPVVRLITTGGTISNRPGNRLSAKELVDAIPDLASHVRVEIEEYSNVGSSSLTLDDWLALSRRVNTVLSERSDLAGIVVTSGTDTLEETAYFLHLTVRDPRPVVVVGAMRNPSLLGYDGSANLLQALRVAGDPAARDHGVLVVLNGQIDSARDVTKTDTRNLHTFAARGRGILGLVDRDRVVFYRRVLARHTARSEFDVTRVRSLPRVDIILVYQDASGDLVRAAADAGARGIVVASAGAGATTRSQRQALADVAERGVVVVTSSRTGSGRIAPPRDEASPSGESASGRTGDAAAGQPAEEGRDERATGAGGDVGTRRYPRVAAEDLAPLKARILLMLALTETDDIDEIQRMFGEY